MSSATTATANPAAPSPAAGASAGAKPSGMPLLTEVPTSLKKLVKLVARGFYTVEDRLIVDMLARFPCLREEDLADLLKFERKMLRAKMSTLQKDKLVQTKQRIETDAESKVTRMTCYFINYKIFVNIVKYKLDHMHKKMEKSERDETTRSSFKCQGCGKTFTDLEANQLFDPQTGEFRCTFCSGVVDEDESSGPQKDSRQLLAKFNTQMEKLYELLRLVESIQLAPVVLDPEPSEIVRGKDGAKKQSAQRPTGPQGPDGRWSGDVTRNVGLRPEDQHVNITFGDQQANKAEAKREVPVWMQESTVTQDSVPSGAPSGDEDSNLDPLFGASGDVREGGIGAEQSDEITSLLLKHEKRSGAGQPFIPGAANSDSDQNSDESDDEGKRPFSSGGPTSSSTAAAAAALAAEFEMEDTSRDQNEMSDDDDDGDIPTVMVGNEEIAVTDVNEEIIAKMSTEEKEKYTQTFQDFYSHMYE